MPLFKLLRDTALAALVGAVLLGKITGQPISAWIGALLGALFLIPRWVGFFTKGTSPDQNQSGDSEDDWRENPLALIGFTILTVFFWTMVVGISKNMPPAWVGAIIGGIVCVPDWVRLWRRRRVVPDVREAPSSSISSTP
ncbi:MAG: hypothetical protein ACTH1Z_10755 [Ancrocorticia sp.]|uniref:hypothetical protein n=1 Tax=Ancrocorticia sp. TaxID=2593684 RepID=UPI003F9016CE